MSYRRVQYNRQQQRGQADSEAETSRCKSTVRIRCNDTDWDHLQDEEEPCKKKDQASDMLLSYISRYAYW